MFPGLLIEAINNEIWAHPRQMAYKLAPPMPLEGVRTPHHSRAALEQLCGDRA